VGAGSTTPERLRRVTAVLVVGCLASALVSVLAGLERTSSVEEARTRISALTADSAELYRALADADAMATSGYVAGGRESTAVRARYDDDVARATDRLVDAAGRLPEGGPTATIAAQLPVYTGLVETARTLNRAGLPLGLAYLGSASQLMRTTILPAADELHRTQAAELDAAHDRGVAIPFAVLLLVAATPGSSTSPCASAAARIERSAWGCSRRPSPCWSRSGGGRSRRRPRTGGSTPRSDTAPPRVPWTTRAPPSSRRAAARA
jgi:hypothetical protein